MNLNEVSISILKFEEGFSENPYYCSEGYPTIGIGQRIGPKDHPLHNYSFKCPTPVAESWCSVEVERLSELLSKYDWYISCSQNRKAIFISMAYQLGINGLLKFKKMLAAVQDEDWDVAYMEGLDSVWAKKTPKRAKRQMQVIRSDKLDGSYE